VRRIRKRSHVSVVVVAAVAAALALVAPAVRRRRRGGGTSTTATTIGKGEGSLNVIEWPYYTDKSFASRSSRRRAASSTARTPARRTRCSRSCTGTGAAERPVRPRLGLGRREPSPHRAGDVKPIDINQIPSWKDFLPQFKSPAAQHGRRQALRVSLQWGPNTLIYNTQKVNPAPTAGPRSTPRRTRASSPCRTTRFRSRTRRFT
jgi:spermidine/putrescine-binding protein